MRASRVGLSRVWNEELSDETIGAKRDRRRLDEPPDFSMSVKFFLSLHAQKPRVFPCGDHRQIDLWGVLAISIKTFRCSFSHLNERPSGAWHLNPWSFQVVIGFVSSAAKVI